METQTRPRHRFTVEDYHRMGSAGIFGPEDRVELIDGDIVEMSPIGSLHAGTVKGLIHFLGSRVGEAALVAAQDPVVISNYSEPEPDIMLLRPRADFYRESHPGPADVLLLVEVSDTTLGFDRLAKLRVYAQAGIPEYWIVNVRDAVIEVHRKPRGDTYQERLELRRGDRLFPASMPLADLRAEEILGPEEPVSPGGAPSPG